ncbi:MAG: VOC family protein [Novosphingobium sp.]|nr:VOC family protein [Novosphingobium sp.]
MSSVFGNVRQIGLMSRDIDRSMRYFVDRWGMGPWFVLRNISNSMLYHGNPVELQMSIAMANCGDMQFEIVMQHNDTQSLYTDALAHTPDLHVQHVAVWVDDVAAVERASHEKGWRSIFETKSGPGRSVFVTHPDEPMVCIEVSDCDPFKEKVRETIREIAENWDGADPIRDGLPV